MKPYILIVDDEFGLADAVAEILVERGYETSVVINGKLALASLEARLPDLVLTDMMMPVLDGPGLVVAMRADARFARLPVIMMTALPDAVPSGVEANALIAKPFPLTELLVLVHKLLR
jgi:DNA-binding response OmpR family regulator